MNKLFKYILENYNDGSEKVDSSTELYKVLTKTLSNKIGHTLGISDLIVKGSMWQGNKIFCCQRGPKGECAFKWEFPGGKIEEGESKEECLIREIKEELNANISIVQYLNTIEYDYPTFHLIMHNFICSLKDNHYDLIEHEAAKFVKVTLLDQVEFLPADILILDDLKKYLSSK